MILQQSHHCGIETARSSSSFRMRSRQQSHHCGIETKGGIVMAAARQVRSNRTIVGLKPQVAQDLEGKHFMQQSHHCGIETLATLRAAPTLPPGSNRTIVGLKLEAVGG